MGSNEPQGVRWRLAEWYHVRPTCLMEAGTAILATLETDLHSEFETEWLADLQWPLGPRLCGDQGLETTWLHEFLKRCSLTAAFCGKASHLELACVLNLIDSRN